MFNVEKSGIQQPAHTVSGRVEQAQNWLTNPSVDDKGLGLQAIQLVVEEGRKVAEGLPIAQKNEIMAISNDVNNLSHQLSDLCRRGMVCVKNDCFRMLELLIEYYYY